MLEIIIPNETHCMNKRLITVTKAVRLIIVGLDLIWDSQLSSPTVTKLRAVIKEKTLSALPKHVRYKVKQAPKHLR